MRVLYVEDDPACQRLLQKLLEHEGFEVVVQESSRDAIELLKTNRFDILVLDIMMPGIDGFQVGRSARRESIHKDIPIILLTAHPYALREYDAKWLQPVAWLTKPFRRERLLQVIQSLLPGAGKKISASADPKFNGESDSPSLVRNWPSLYRDPVIEKRLASGPINEGSEPSNPVRVLYVEDDPASQRLIRKVLEHAGIDVMVRESGHTAIDLLKQHEFDAVILDIMMPGIDGFQVGRSMRADGPNQKTPIIFLTAHPYALRESEANRLRPLACLTKPFDQKQLLDLLAVGAFGSEGAINPAVSLDPLKASVTNNPAPTGKWSACRAIGELLSADSSCPLSQ